MAAEETESKFKIPEVEEAVDALAEIEAAPEEAAAIVDGITDRMVVESERIADKFVSDTGNMVEFAAQHAGDEPTAEEKRQAMALNDEVSVLVGYLRAGVKAVAEQTDAESKKTSQEVLKNTKEGVKETERKTIELLDTAGNRIGTAEVGYGVEVDSLDTEVKKRLLTSLILKGEQGDRNVTIDILGLTNKRSTKIFVDKEAIGDEFDQITNTVKVRAIDSSDDIGMLLHELGHAEQFGEEKYQKMDKGYSGVPFLERFLENIQTIAEAVPEIKASIPWEQAISLQKEQREIKEEKQKIDVWQKEYDAVKEQRKEFQPSDDEYQDLEKKIRATQDKLRQANLSLSKRETVFNQGFEAIADSLRQVERLPTRIMERDATRRAFQWMRKIRQKTGINLYTDSRKELRSGLESYGAEQNPLRYSKKSGGE